jgi:Domain of unknown function (DUF397)
VTRFDPRFPDADPAENSVPCRGGNGVQFTRRWLRRVAVRDSKDPTGPALIFKRADIAQFVAELKDGQYDHLLTSDRVPTDPDTSPEANWSRPRREGEHR